MAQDARARLDTGRVPAGRLLPLHASVVEVRCRGISRKQHRLTTSYVFFSSENENSILAEYHCDFTCFQKRMLEHACLNYLVLVNVFAPLAGLINFSDDADNASLEGLVNAVDFAQQQIVLRLGVPLAALTLLMLLTCWYCGCCGCGCCRRSDRVKDAKRKTS